MQKVHLSGHSNLIVSFVASSLDMSFNVSIKRNAAIVYQRIYHIVLIELLSLPSTFQQLWPLTAMEEAEAEVQY